MSTDNPSLFKDKHRNVCEIIPVPEDSPKICPTCIPDKNAIEVNWWEQLDPFLDPKNCMYSVAVGLNDEGKPYSVSDIRDSGMSVKQVIETYKIFGILQILRYFNKEISNEVIYAFPEKPEKFANLMRQENRKIADSVQVIQQILPNGIASVYDIPGPVAEDLELKAGEVFNPIALELYAQVNDYYISNYQTPIGGEPILVNVTIPAFILDRIPNAKAPEQVDTTKSVKLKGIELKGKIDRLKHALGVFGKYQAYWWQTEKGRLAFQKSLPSDDASVITVNDLTGETYEDYYCKNYTQKLDEFIEDLEYLIESETNFKLRRVTTPRAVESIQIFFEEDNEENPFKISKIKVTGLGCSPQTISLSKIKKTNSPSGEEFTPPFNNQTLMGYIANLNDIDEDLQARETPPWVDFVVKYTFPKVSIQYGKGDSLSDFGQPETILGCVIDNLGGRDGLRDFFLETTVTFFDAIQYKWNQNACKTLTGDYEAREGGLFDQRQERRGETEESLALEQTINDKQEEIRSLQDLIAKSETNISDSSSLQTAISDLDDELREDIKKNKDKIKDLEKKRKEATKQLETLEAELGSDFQDDKDEIRQEIQDYNSQIISLVNENEEIQDTRSIDADFETDISTDEDFIKELQSEIELIKSEIADLEREKRKAEDSIAEQRRENRDQARQENKEARKSDKEERKKASADRLLDELQNNESDANDTEDDKSPSVRKEMRQTRRAQRQDRRQGERQAKGEFRGEDPFIKAGREAVLDQFDFENSLVSLFLSEEDFDDYGLSGFDFSKPLSKVKDGIGVGKGALKNEASKKLRRFISRLGVCGLNDLAKKAIQCLLAGVDLDTALRAIVKAALNAMAPQGMEKLLAGLDPRVQQEIKEKVAEEFGNMPAPWEEGYESGSITSNAELQTESIGSLSNDVDSIQAKISNLQSDIEQINQEINEKTLKIDGFEELIQVPSDDIDFQEGTKAEIRQLQHEVDSLKEQMPIKEKELEDLQKEKDASIPSESSAELEAWRNLSPEEQEKLTEDQQNARIVAINNPEQATQGSMGKALGSVQVAIFDAYIEAIMDVAEISQLFSALDKLPGAKLIARLIASFDCPNVHFIYPPIKSFLSSLSFDICKDRGRLAIPTITNIPDIKSIKELILQLARDSIEYALEVVIVRTVTAFVLKILQTLENALCKALESVGRFAAEAVKGPNADFGSVVNEIFCGSNADEDEIDDITSSLLTSIGMTPEKLTKIAEDATPTSLKDQHKQIVTDISNVTSKRELVALLTDNPGEQDPLVLKRISNCISLRHPQFAFAFDAPDKVAQVFGALGNFITPEQRREIRDRLADQPFDIPVESSICLTKDQLDEWNDKRKNILTNSGLTPEEANEVVEKYNDRAKSDLQDLANVLAKSPTSVLQDAIADALKTDPDCEDGNSLTKGLPPEAKKKREHDAEGVFRSLQISFANDMVGKNDSLLDNILADTLNAPLRKHENLIDNVIFRIDYANSETDWETKKAKYDQTRLGSLYFRTLSGEEAEGVFPETIGIKSRTSLLENDFNTNYTLNIKRARQTSVREVDFGFLGLGKKEVKTTKPYLKEPDLSLLFDNGQDLKISFDVESIYTTQEDNKVKIQKNFGQKVNITYEAKNDTLEQQTDIESDSSRRDKNKVVTIPIYKISNSILPDASSSAFIDNFDLDFEELQIRKVPYQYALLTNYFNQVLTASVSDDIVKNAFTIFTQKLYKDTTESLVSDKDNNIPIGYKFGYEPDSVKTEDLLYVNPEADPEDDSTWEYTYENEDMVLGKSATENPRVHFLDPNLYGGSYTNPPFYVEPSQYDGWLGLTQVVVPEIDGCKPKRTDLIDFKGMSKEVSKIESRIEPDKRLALDPNCVKHIPFDHIADPNTTAHMDVVVSAAVRVYCVEAIIKSMPILSFLEYNSKNYDNLLAEMIVKEMQQEMPLESSFIPIGRYQRYNYWLVFLEQVSQSVIRKIDSGEIKTTPEIDNARNAINEMQKDYVYPTPEDLELVRQVREFDYSSLDPAEKTITGLAGGLSVLAWPSIIAAGGVLAGTAAVGLGLMSLRQLRFATKMDLLHKAKKHSMVLLKALVSFQLTEMSKLISEKTSLRPYISDLNKYILSNKNFTGGTDIKAGLYEVEKPIVLGETGIPYGDIMDVSRVPVNTNLASKLPADFTNGCFLVEKYIKIIDKKLPSTPLGSQLQSNREPPATLPQIINIINNRPDYLHGVCNINDFANWARNAIPNIDPNLNISDLFGNAQEIAGQSEGYEGSIGLQFGVRLSIVLPSELGAIYSNNGLTQDKINLEKSYKFGDCFVVPLARSEYDLKDIKFVDLKLDDPNLGEDIKCHFDLMCETTEFKTFMNYIFGTNKISSLAAVYMNHSFIQSIGQDPSERDLDNAFERFDESWKGEILSDTKDEIRRLFVGFYRSNDFEEPDDEDDTTLRDFLKNVMPKIFGVNKSLIPWWRRRRLRDRPYDKDGNECSGEYGSFFKGDE